jgi:hypothetical protein
MSEGDDPVKFLEQYSTKLLKAQTANFKLSEEHKAIVTGGEQQSSSASFYGNRIRLPTVQRHSRVKTSTRENLFTIKRRLSEFGSCLADTADPWGQRTIGVASHMTEQKRTIQTSTPSSQYDSILAHRLIHKRATQSHPRSEFV